MSGLSTTERRSSSTLSIAGGLIRMSRPWNFGFSIGPGLLTMAVVAELGPWDKIARFLTAAACIHAFGYISNDLFDRHIDELDRRRASHPLTTGVVSERNALVAALMLLTFVSLGICALWASHRAEALLLALATCLSIAYNCFSKRTAYPVWTDAVLGLAFATTPLLASEMAIDRISPFSVACATYQLLFMLVVNGAYGSVRDLAHEAMLGVKTTASFFGSSVSNGTVFLSRSLYIYIVCLHGGLLAALLWIHINVSARLGSFAWRGATATLVTGLVALSAWSLERASVAFRQKSKSAAAYATVHMICTFLCPVAVCIGVLRQDSFGVIVAIVAPLFFHRWFLRAGVFVVLRALNLDRNFTRSWSIL